MTTPYNEMNDEQLSALIAEQVMGWRVQWFDRFYHNINNNNEWSQNRATSKENCHHTPVAYWKDLEDCCLHQVDEWNPAGEDGIADAMLVVEKMRAQQFAVGLACDEDSEQWSATFDNINGPFTAEDKSLPRAICLAAIDATTNTTAEQR